MYRESVSRNKEATARAIHQDATVRVMRGIEGQKIKERYRHPGYRGVARFRNLHFLHFIKYIDINIERVHSSVCVRFSRESKYEIKGSKSRSVSECYV